MPYYISTLEFTEQGPRLQLPEGFPELMDSIFSQPTTIDVAANWLQERSEQPLVVLTTYSDSQLLQHCGNPIPFAYQVRPLNESLDQLATQESSELQMLKRQLAIKENRLSTTEDSLRACQEQISLARTIVHDVNNFLLVIYFSCNEVLANLPADDSNRPAVAAIVEARKHAVECTRQFANAHQSRLLDANNTVVDLNDVIVQTEHLLNRFISTDVIVSVQLSPTPAFIFVGYEQVCQLVLNLALNAMNAVSDGGWITIETRLEEPANTFRTAPSTTSQGSYVRLIVSDTGSRVLDGTNEAAVSKIGRNSSFLMRSVRKIVQQCGGTIDLAASAEIGTQIEVRLPLCLDTVVPPTPERNGTQSRSTMETILLVDDEATLRKYVKNLLVSHGFNVLEAGDGVTAIAIAMNQLGGIDLLLTDMSLPGISGQEVANRIRSADPRVSVILVSGSSPVATDRDSKFGVFLQKPFQATDLLQLVRNTLDSRVAVTGARNRETG